MLKTHSKTPQIICNQVSKTPIIKGCMKAYTKSGLLAPPLLTKIIPMELGIILPDGKIKFQNEESAIKYIHNRLQEALNRPKAQQIERAIVKKGTTILGESDGSYYDVSLGNIKGIHERIHQKVPRDLEVFHSHPDVWGKGETHPLSGPNSGDIDCFFSLKLKKDVAINSKGEFNSIEIGEDFSEEKYEQFKKGYNIFLDEILYMGLLDKYEKLSKERLKYDFDNIPQWLENETLKIFKKIIEIDSLSKKSKIFAKKVHNYYKKANAYGMIYTTNFSNLISRYELIKNHFNNLYKKILNIFTNK